MDDLFSRQVKAEAVTVKSFDRLVSIQVTGSNFKASYKKTLYLPDGTDVQFGTYSVDRSLDTLGQDVLDWIAVGAQFTEKWRQEDDDQRAADAAKRAAEAARWALLTPDQQQAEIDAARKNFGNFDPTPLGP